MTDPMENMEKMTQNLMQACDEMNAASRQSVDALVEASAVTSKGCEEFSRNLGGLVQDLIARTVTASKTMLTAKNIQDLTQLQNEFVKNLFDTWVEGAGRLSQISARMTREAFEPVMKQANDAVQNAVQKTQQGRAA